VNQAPSAPPALELEQVGKDYEGVPAVAGLSLRLAPGEFYALLGPNGAGKTTSLRMIAGLLAPDRGRIRVLGHDIVTDPIAAKRGLAFLPDEPMLYGKLRSLEYLEFVAGLWGLDARSAQARAQQLLEWLELWEARGQYLDGYSRGMQQKLALAGALIHQPRLLILDEPLTGLDASAARKVKDLLLQLTREGLTVLFTTHILEVAERLATRIGLIRGGRLVAEDTLQGLRALHGAEATLEDIFLAATAEGPRGAAA
jgi:ABC-2 type transport system ATP-binding protein